MYRVTVTETWTFDDDEVDASDVKADLEALTQDVNSNSWDFVWEHLKDRK